MEDIEAETNSDKYGCNANRRDIFNPIVSQKHKGVPRHGKRNESILRAAERGQGR